MFPVVVPNVRRRKFKVSVIKTRRATQQDIAKRRDIIQKKAGKAYDKERDYMDRKRRDALNETRLVVGSLCMLHIKNALRTLKAPFGSSWLPVCVENVFADQSSYQVRAKGSLISQPIKRDCLTKIDNDALQKEILSCPLKNFEGMGLERYLKTYWVWKNDTPMCNCKNGCKTNSCPCRVAGHGCGTHCHPAYYKKHPCCKNYKGELD
jgi:hypothetical protein